MRTFIYTVLTIALLSASAMNAGCATGSSARSSHIDRAALADQGPIESSSATLVVHGMGCPLCANNVDKQLLAVPGVTDVRIDLGDGSVKVMLAETNRPTMAQLVKAVDDSGFTLVSTTTP